MACFAVVYTVCDTRAWRILQVQILWQDGFNQVAPFELLAMLPALDRQQLAERRRSHVCSADRAFCSLCLRSAGPRACTTGNPAACMPPYPVRAALLQLQQCNL